MTNATLQFISVSELMPILTELKESVKREAEFPPVMTMKQICKYLQISEQTVRNRIADKGLPVSDKLGDPRFIKSEVDEWLAGKL